LGIEPLICPAAKTIVAIDADVVPFARQS